MSSRKSTTVDQWFDEWMEVYKRRTVKQGTLDTYRAMYRAQIGPVIGSRSMTAVDCGMLQGMINSLCDRGYSRSAVDLARALCSGMFGQAVRCGIIRRNPCDGLVMPKDCRRCKSIRALTREETTILLKYSEGLPIEGMIRLALMTGMRGGELAALRWRDIDLDKGVIHVRHTLKQAKGRRWLLDTPKTASSVRVIPLVPGAVELLRESTEPAEEDFVFSLNDGPVVKGQMQSELRKIQGKMRDAGEPIPHFTFHCLRHTFATRCIEAGMSPKILQGILGHSSLAVTMDIYVSVTDEERKKQMLLAASAW